MVLRLGGDSPLYYHRNQQYSITALTDDSGTIVERSAYTAYGQVTFHDASGTVQTASASNNNRYTYTGRQWGKCPDQINPILNVGTLQHLRECCVLHKAKDAPLIELDMFAKAMTDCLSAYSLAFDIAGIVAPLPKWLQ